MLTYKLILFGLLLIFSTLLCAQFTDVGGSLGINNESSFSLNGSGISFYDFDRDGWDDITMATNAIPIKCYRNLQGTGFELFLTFPNDFTVKQVTWVDYDNDGDSDLFVTRSGASCVLYRNDGNFQFTDVTDNLNLSSLFANSYGCSWADYDRDGWLDVFVCNCYEGEPSHSWLFHNNGDGTFTEKSIETGIDMGLQKSFQSTWFDYNLDGWLDLFIINTLYTGNFFYQNNGDGTFTDISLTTGANYPVDAMCASVCDFDKDYDFDIFISNSEMGNVMLEYQSNGLYYNSANQSGLLNDYNVCWGSLWFDADNDFDQDLHVCSSLPAPGYFYLNNNDGTMIATSDPAFDLDYGINYCNAKGDFDNNGFYDVAVSRNAPADAGLFVNTPSDNHWIKFGLTGTISNRDGIGALIKAYSGGESQVFNTQAGDNYLSQNSAYNIIGLGSNETLDSLIVNWPNGWVDKYTKLPSDSFYSFIEGETSGMNEEIISLGICPGSNLVLSSLSGESAIWFDGSEGDSLVVSDPGLYWVDVFNQFELSSRIYFDVVEFDIPQFSIVPFHPTCPYLADGAIYFASAEPNSPEVYWSGLNSTDWNITGLPAGQYPCLITYGNGCTITTEMELSSPDPLEVLFDIPIACYGTSVEVELIILNEEYEVEIDWNGLNPQEVYNGEHEIYISYQSTCTDTFSFNVQEADPIAIYDEVIMPFNGNNGSIELEVSGGIPYYQFDWVNSGEEGSTLYNVGQGIYACLVTDSLGCSALIQIELIDLSTDNATHADIAAFGPNPFNDYICISRNSNDLPVTMYNISGQQIDIDQSSNRIDTRSLSDGVYYLFSGIHPQKLVKFSND